MQPDMGPAELRHRRLVHVDDGGIITASAMCPFDFAHAILERLHVFSEAALDAWYDLYKTRAPRFYAAFMEAVSHGNRA